MECSPRGCTTLFPRPSSSLIRLPCAVGDLADANRRLLMRNPRCDSARLRCRRRCRRLLIPACRRLPARASSASECAERGSFVFLDRLKVWPGGKCRKGNGAERSILGREKCIAETVSSALLLFLVEGNERKRNVFPLRGRLRCSAKSTFLLPALAAVISLILFGSVGSLRCPHMTSLTPNCTGKHETALVQVLNAVLALLPEHMPLDTPRFQRNFPLV